MSCLCQGLVVQHSDDLPRKESSLFCDLEIAVKQMYQELQIDTKVLAVLAH